MQITNPKWRLATPHDVCSIGKLSREILGVLGEEDIIFEERQRLCPSGCYVLTEGDIVGGYIVAHPWILKNPPALNKFLEQLPLEADCWYIHDIAISESFRGTGAAAVIVEQIASLAISNGFSTIALVAVSGASRYWSRIGFQDAMTVSLRSKLKSYGEDALYMERLLT